MNKKELRVIIPENLYKKFKRKCKSEYKTMSEVSRSFIVEYIKENKNV